MHRLASWLLFASCSPARREAAVAPEPAAHSTQAVAVVATDASPEVAVPVVSAVPVVIAEDDDLESGASPTDGGAPDIGATTECPAKWASGAAFCTPAGTRCAYPEGTCECAPASYCGGAAPPPHIVKRNAVPRWICRPSPKTLGPDGCPLGIPSGACTTPGKACRYRQCCVFTLTCSGGKWLQSTMSCPP